MMGRACAGKYGVALTSTVALKRSGCRVAMCSSTLPPALKPGPLPAPIPR